MIDRSPIYAGRCVFLKETILFSKSMGVAKTQRSRKSGPNADAQQEASTTK